MVILVVDDTFDIIALLDAMMGRIMGTDYEILPAKDGAEALAILNQMTVLPDLILSNIRMPVMDGITFIRHVRSNPLWERLPVVMMSALFSDAICEEALACGVVGFLDKPFSFRDVENLLYSFVFR